MQFLVRWLTKGPRVLAMGLPLRLPHPLWCRWLGWPTDPLVVVCWFALVLCLFGLMPYLYVVLEIVYVRVCCC